MLTKGAEGHPRLYCDHCGNRILDPAMANAIYLSHPSAEGRLSEVMYVHRECDDPFQRENPTQGKYQWMWKALDQHLDDLFHEPDDESPK